MSAIGKAFFRTSLKLACLAHRELKRKTECFESCRETIPIAISERAHTSYHK